MIFVYILEIFIVNLAALDPTLTHKQQSCFTDGRRPLLSKLTERSSGVSSHQSHEDDFSLNSFCSFIKDLSNQFYLCLATGIVKAVELDSNQHQRKISLRTYTIDAIRKGILVNQLQSPITIACQTKSKYRNLVQ